MIVKKRDWYDQRLRQLVLQRIDVIGNKDTATNTNMMKKAAWEDVLSFAVLKYILAFYLGVVLYCELFVYVTQQLYWPKLECSSEDASCTKILFVADPQIQGDNFAPHPLNQIFNWDSDRYLKSTFGVVENYFKPDMVIYLGDLMDEGSQATIKQYKRYVKRLADIFEMERPVVQLWVSGDNDVGGENEPVFEDKVELFRKTYNQPDYITFRNITVFKVNIKTKPTSKVYEGYTNPANLDIVVSHYPLLVHRRKLKYEMNEETFPYEIYFCAHLHESKYMVQTTDFTDKHTFPLKEGDPILEISFNGKLVYEIYVPTCSYRMGTSHIGYGAALVENNQKSLRYTVLWSPGRFPSLFFYIAILIAPALYLVVYFTVKQFYRQQQELLGQDYRYYNFVPTLKA